MIILVIFLHHSFERFWNLTNKYINQNHIYREDYQVQHNSEGELSKRLFIQIGASIFTFKKAIIWLNSVFRFRPLDKENTNLKTLLLNLKFGSWLHLNQKYSLQNIMIQNIEG